MIQFVPEAAECENGFFCVYAPAAIRSPVSLPDRSGRRCENRKKPKSAPASPADLRVAFYFVLFSRRPQFQTDPADFIGEDAVLPPQKGVVVTDMEVPERNLPKQAAP